jgi:hypothetical protein
MESYMRIGDVEPGRNAGIPASRRGVSSSAASTARPGDRVEIGSAREPERGKPLRHDLIDRVRADIASGTYDTPERLDRAVESLLSRLNGATSG